MRSCTGRDSSFPANPTQEQPSLLNNSGDDLKICALGLKFEVQGFGVGLKRDLRLERNISK